MHCLRELKLRFCQNIRNESVQLLSLHGSSITSLDIGSCPYGWPSYHNLIALKITNLGIQNLVISDTAFEHLNLRFSLHITEEAMYHHHQEAHIRDPYKQ